MVIDPIVRRDRLAVGVFGSSCVFVWDTTPTLELNRFCRAVLDEHTSDESPFALVSIVGPNVSAPPFSVLDDIVAQTRHIEQRLCAIAVVIESTGFAGTAVRSALTAMSILSRASFPIRLLAHCDEADVFLREHCPSHPRDHSLAAVVSALRSR